ncbi:BadF/BadG/BcrA/BcrD ATPase family protein [Thermocatellispora tengchongensis]|uniref:BadF/BadG/BcrA/BcrD ATPase family protein n=1 Tax=Thermocatellispora tengchongensis TaxID=1073253 RepID=UPI0036325285
MGVAVVCGAGINAVGVSPTGAVARFPALGALSGDWGGGLTLGREALWHAVRAEDGRGPATALAGAVTDCFGARTVEEVVLALHFGEVPMDRLNDLSPWVFRVAAGGDATAVALVLRLAEEVTLFAEVAMRRLDLLDTPTEVVLGGGVLAAADPLLIGRIGELLALRAPQAKPLITGTPPIVGAALLGLDHLGAGEKAAEAVRAALSPGDRP